MDKKLKAIWTDYGLEVLYILVLIVVLFFSSRRPGEPGMLLGGVFIISLWVLPFFLKLWAKIINTLILGVSIPIISSIFYRNTQNRAGYLSLVISILLYCALILNIFFVIKELYQREPQGGKRDNGLKLLYVILAFIILIGTIILSYGHIYENIMLSDPQAFAVGSEVTFLAVYYSSVTYFTVGYGDIVPKSDLARAVSISQMVSGYIVTCLILPTVLVAFQKLFQKTRI